MSKFFTIAAVIAGMLFGLPGIAHADDALGAAAADQVSQRVADLVARLELTEDQKQEVEAILRDSMEKRFAILESYGFESDARPKLRPRQKRGLRNDMKDVADATTADLADVLTEEQMAEFAVIQEEQREALRERLQER